MGGARDPRVLISTDALWEDGFGALFPVVDGTSAFADQRAALDPIEGVVGRLCAAGVAARDGAAIDNVD